MVVEGRLGGSAGLSGDGAESRTGVMERRGWTGAEWGRGGAPFPGEAKGVAGPGGEEKGAGGVARRLPTSEYKFHLKKNARPLGASFVWLPQVHNYKFGSLMYLSDTI